MTIGEKIRIFAEKKGFSLTLLAELLGMKPQSLQVYISGKSLPGSEILQKFRDLGCDINWLLSDSPDPPPETNQLLQARIQQLEEENQRLRDSISQLALLIEKEIKEINKKHPKKPIKRQ